MSLRILTGFDGSCPHSNKGVKQKNAGTFVLFPGTRNRADGISEEATGAGSRFWTRIENGGSRPRKVCVIADWETTQRTKHHDFGYIRLPNDDWRMTHAFRRGAQFLYHLTVPPGITDLALYPEYNTADCAGFIEQLSARKVTVKKIGASRKKRPLHLISCPSPNSLAKPFFIQARDHAYESAGSYCVEGISEFLLSNDPMAAYLRSKFHVFMVPMTNPDGVHDGMSRLTWERGADMNRVCSLQKDTAHETLLKTINHIRPFVHMNIHNWTHRHRDGLLSNEEDIARLITEHMPADHAHYKHWYVQTTYDFLRDNKFAECPDKHKSWKNYCKEKWNATGVNFEFPWFYRTPHDMRTLGAKAFIALALAVIEVENL